MGEVLILVIGAKQIVKLDILEFVKLWRVNEFDLSESEGYFLFLPQALAFFFDAGGFSVLKPALKVLLVGLVRDDVGLP
jgi:hypothetical protein